MGKRVWLAVADSHEINITRIYKFDWVNHVSSLQDALSILESLHQELNYNLTYLHSCSQSERDCSAPKLKRIQVIGEKGVMLIPKQFSIQQRQKKRSEESHATARLHKSSRWFLSSLVSFGPAVSTLYIKVLRARQERLRQHIYALAVTIHRSSYIVLSGKPVSSFSTDHSARWNLYFLHVDIIWW